MVDTLATRVSTARIVVRMWSDDLWYFSSHKHLGHPDDALAVHAGHVLAEGDPEHLAQIAALRRGDLAMRVDTSSSFKIFRLLDDDGLFVGIERGWRVLGA